MAHVCTSTSSVSHKNLRARLLETSNQMQSLSIGFRIFLYLVVLVAVQDAQAVYINSNGTGQALIFPYYSAQIPEQQPPFNTYLSIVNSNSGAKVLRVRFREGRKGQQVASFNLYLGTGDTWTGAVVPSSTGARLITADKSCVNPAFTAEGASGFRSLELSSDSYANDGLGAGPERMREGYVEVIEMAGLIGASSAAVSRPPNDLAATAPANCAAVQGSAVSLDLSPPNPAGLAGTFTLINVANGLNFTANADALAELTSSPFYRDVGDPYPDFNSAEVLPVSTFTAGGKVYRATWGTGLEAVESVLMKGTIENEVILDAVTNSHTDWIMTLPMSRFHPDSGNEAATTYPLTTRAGVATDFILRPRDGYPITLAFCSGLCPARTFESVPSLPWVANVLTFARGTSDSPSWNYPSSTSVFGSANGIAITTPTGWENGSASQSLSRFKPQLVLRATSIRLSDGSLGTENPVAMRGVPAVGFMARTFQNGQLPCGSAICQGNYGGAYPHKSQPALQ